MTQTEWGTTVRMPLPDVLTQWTPGSYDETVDEKPWTWDDEAADVQRRGLLSAAMVRSVRESGVREPEPGEEPIILGNDGRVWSGHRRIVAGIIAAVPDLPVVVADSDE